MANQFLTLISSTVYTGAVADPFDLGQMPPSLFSSIEIYLFTVASYFEIADLLLIFMHVGSSGRKAIGVVEHPQL